MPATVQQEWSTAVRSACTTIRATRSNPLIWPPRRWVFDAVYVPMRTEFLTMANESRASAISGAELLFWQAVDAFRAFHGATPWPQMSCSSSAVWVWPEVERRAAEGL